MIFLDIIIKQTIIVQTNLVCWTRIVLLCYSKTACSDLVAHLINPACHKRSLNLESVVKGSKRYEKWSNYMMPMTFFIQRTCTRSFHYCIKLSKLFHCDLDQEYKYAVPKKLQRFALRLALNCPNFSIVTLTKNTSMQFQSSPNTIIPLAMPELRHPRLPNENCNPVSLSSLYINLPRHELLIKIRNYVWSPSSFLPISFTTAAAHWLRQI